MDAIHGSPSSAPPLYQTTDLTDPPNTTPNPTQPKPYNVSVHHGALTEAVVGAHNVVVFTGLRLEELLHWNEFCHARSIAFISADVKVGGEWVQVYAAGHSLLLGSIQAPAAPD